MKKILKNKSNFIWIIFIILLVSIGYYIKDNSRGEKSVDDERPSWQQSADDKVTLDWYVNFSWFTTQWGNNVVTKKITEDTGINVKFISPMGNEIEKFNAL